MGNVKNNKYKFDMRDYFKLLFRGRLKSNERYMVSYFDKKVEGKVFERQYNSIEDMCCNIDTHKYYNNVFVSLATVQKDKTRKKENLKHRGVLAFDFDKKDYEEGFNHKDVLKRFQKVGIYYHMLVSSGRGYHAYVMLEPTDDIDRLVNINKSIAKKLGADMGGTSTTQILRVPNTYNYKDNKQRKCNVIWLQSDPKKRIEYSLDNLYKRHCNKADDTNIKYINRKVMPPCIEKLLEGVGDGHRNFALGRLTKYFQRANNSKEQALEVIKEWNERCNPPQTTSKLEVDFNNYWESDYRLLGCRTDNEQIQEVLGVYCNRVECNKSDKYEIIHLDKTVNIEYKVADKIKYRGDKAMLGGNHIAIISILKVHEVGLNTKQIEEELTSTITRKCVMSKPTMVKVLRELEELKVVECNKSKRKNESNFYKLKDMKVLESEKFVLSYQAVQRYLDGAIGQSALRLYSYMRYRLSKNENVVQEEMARDLNITQKAISKLIKELEKARYLVINTDYSVNPLGANIYEWVL